MHFQNLTMQKQKEELISHLKQKRDAGGIPFYWVFEYGKYIFISVANLDCIIVTLEILLYNF